MRLDACCSLSYHRIAPGDVLSMTLSPQRSDFRELSVFCVRLMGVAATSCTMTFTSAFSPDPLCLIAGNLRSAGEKGSYQLEELSIPAAHVRGTPKLGTSFLDLAISLQSDCHCDCLSRGATDERNRYGKAAIFS